MKRIPRTSAWFFALTFVALTFAMPRIWPDVFSRHGLVCAVSSADGCMVWVNKKRLERYKSAKAGAPTTPPDGEGR